MTIRTSTRDLLDNPPVPVQATLAAAWTSLMFFVIYVDYFHLFQPGAIDQIRGGDIYEFAITPTLMTIFVVVIGIPALMVMLSMSLPSRANRATNLVVASLYVPVMVFNAAGASWDWAVYYGVTIGIEVLILAFILRTAWTWARTATPRNMAAGPGSEPHHAPSLRHGAGVTARVPCAVGHSRDTATRAVVPPRAADAGRDQIHSSPVVEG